MKTFVDILRVLLFYTPRFTSMGKTAIFVTVLFVSTYPAQRGFQTNSHRSENRRLRRVLSNRCAEAWTTVLLGVVPTLRLSVVERGLLPSVSVGWAIVHILRQRAPPLCTSPTPRWHL